MATFATTEQKARLFDLATSVFELTRDGKRDIEDVLFLLQLIKDEPEFCRLCHVIISARKQTGYTFKQVD